MAGAEEGSQAIPGFTKGEEATFLSDGLTDGLPTPQASTPAWEQVIDRKFASIVGGWHPFPDSDELKIVSARSDFTVYLTKGRSMFAIHLTRTIKPAEMDALAFLPRPERVW